LAGIIVAEIATGGAITAALPVIINAITTAMNAAMVVSIIDTIAKAAGYIETYLTQGWARHIQPAAIALATALAMGLVELAMALGVKLAGKGIKAAKSGIKKGIKTTAKGAKKLATTVGKGIKSLLKSGAKLVSKTGSMIIENGKIIIKSLKRGFSKGLKKLNGLIDKILSKFRFKKFKIERKGRHIRIYGEVNPWVLLYDGTIEKIDRKNTHAGDIIEHEGKRGIVLTRNTKPTAKVNKLYENALKNGGKVEVKGGKKTEPFDIVNYGDKTPGLENHHGVLDVWASHNIDGYKSRASDSTTIALTPEQHAATKKYIGIGFLKEQVKRLVVRWNGLVYQLEKFSH